MSTRWGEERFRATLASVAAEVVEHYQQGKGDIDSLTLDAGMKLADSVQRPYSGVVAELAKEVEPLKWQADNEAL